MKLKAKQLKSLIKELLKYNEMGEKWLESIPQDIRQSFYDNNYTEMLYLQKECLMRFAVKDLFEDVYWFLYEWKPGYQIINPNGKEYIINDVDDYIKYLSDEGLVT